MTRLDQDFFDATLENPINGLAFLGVPLHPAGKPSNNLRSSPGIRKALFRGRIRRAKYGLLSALWLSSCSAVAPMAPIRLVSDQPEMPACVARPMPDEARYIVFFQPNSAALSAKARVILDELAERWKRERGSFIRLSARSDGAESRNANHALSGRRGKVVEFYLISDGVRAAV